MARRVNTDDLIDANGVAAILGLSQPESVSAYQKRYADMPRPVVDLGGSRARLWLRPDIEKWDRARNKKPGPRSDGNGRS